MNAEESFDEDVSRLFTICSQKVFSSVKKRCKLSCKTGCRRHIYFYKVTTWGGVLQASVQRGDRTCRTDSRCPTGQGVGQGIGQSGHVLGHDAGQVI